MYGENAQKYVVETLYNGLKTSRSRMMTSINKYNGGIYAFTKGASKKTVLTLEPTENLRASEEAGYDA
jgi:hypothetical protein